MSHLEFVLAWVSQRAGTAPWPIAMLQKISYQDISRPSKHLPPPQTVWRTTAFQNNSLVPVDSCEPKKRTSVLVFRILRQNTSSVFFRQAWNHGPQDVPLNTTPAKRHLETSCLGHHFPMQMVRCSTGHVVGKSVSSQSKMITAFAGSWNPGSSMPSARLCLTVRAVHLLLHLIMCLISKFCRP